MARNAELVSGIQEDDAPAADVGSHDASSLSSCSVISVRSLPMLWCDCDSSIVPGGAIGVDIHGELADAADGGNAECDCDADAGGCGNCCCGRACGRGGCIVGVVVAAAAADSAMASEFTWSMCR